MKAIERISTTELRRNFSEKICEVHLGKRIVVCSQQIPLAVMISYAEAKELGLLGGKKNEDYEV